MNRGRAAGRDRAAGCIEGAGWITKNDNAATTGTTAAVTTTVTPATTTAASVRCPCRSSRIDVRIPATASAASSYSSVNHFGAAAAASVGDRRPRDRRRKPVAAIAA